MISTKLNKNAVAGNLMIEFSENPISTVFQKFYLNCKDQGVLTKRSSLIESNQMNFYLVDLENQVQISNIVLKKVPKNIEFVITVIYLINDQEQQTIETKVPVQRTLLLRQGLDSKFFIHYQYQNTQSQQESLIFLCELSSAIVNSKFQKDICFYDQSTSEIKNQGQSQSQKLWINILYQIPGLGQDKCISIAQTYPNYQSLLSDYEGPQYLKSLMVRRGLKQAKLGDTLANRVYKTLFSSNYEENILEKKF